MSFPRWRQFLRVPKDPESAALFLPTSAQPRALRRCERTWTVVAALAFLLNFASFGLLISAMSRFNMVAASAWAVAVVIQWRLGIGTAAHMVRLRARDQRLANDPVEYGDFLETVPQQPYVLFLRSFFRESLHRTFASQRFFSEWGEEIESSVQIERTLHRLSVPSARLVSVGDNTETSWHGANLVSVDGTQWESQVADLVDGASLVVIYIVKQVGGKGVERELQLASSVGERADKTIIIVPRRVAASFEGDDALRTLDVIGVPHVSVPSWTLILVVTGAAVATVAFGWLPLWVMLPLLVAYTLGSEVIYYIRIWTFARNLLDAARRKATFEANHRWPRAFVLRTLLSVAPYLMRQLLEYPDAG